MKQTLSQQAQEVICAFQELHIGKKTVCTPYMNNRQAGVRAGLRVLIGKGSPKEIEEEAHLIALREKTDLKKLSEKELRVWLVEHHLGIDCSGFVYYVLAAEAEAHKKNLKRNLTFPLVKNPIRKLLTKLRTVENAGVKTLIHEKNAQEVVLKEVQPGDLIYMIKGKKTGNPDHVLIVSEVEKDKKNVPERIIYTHSLKWETDSAMQHGIRTGVIEIIDSKKELEKQIWKEQGNTGKSNLTFARFIDAKVRGIARLKILP